MIHPERIQNLSRKPFVNDSFVVYWMQQAQRIKENHALAYAVQMANELNLPLVVVFALTDTFPEANYRHYHFMLKGLAQTQQQLRHRGIGMFILHGDPPDVVLLFCKRAALVVTDCGYLRVQKAWRKLLADRLSCPLVQVETDVIVPVGAASPKEEYSAGTIRPKLRNRMEEFLSGVSIPDIRKDSLSIEDENTDVSDADALCRKLSIDMSVAPVGWIIPGEMAAERMLDSFIAERLDYFGDLRNDPSCDYLSHMSPYLHFGQISPIRIARKVMASASKASDAFIEELFIRRELAMNFVHYNARYDSIACLPQWALKTLSEHGADKRMYHYTRKQLEKAQTHDEYWNAAQIEMVKKGKMHGYMRMYWGKKILEWTKSPATAFKTALLLNNKYSLDGRDPNGFAGVAWCFGKHDRAWNERDIFGKVRYMNNNGLKRKFNIEQYVLKVERWTDI